MFNREQYKKSDYSEHIVHKVFLRSRKVIIDKLLGFSIPLRLKQLLLLHRIKKVSEDFALTYLLDPLPEEEFLLLPDDLVGVDCLEVGVDCRVLVETLLVPEDLLSVTVGRVAGLW